MPPTTPRPIAYYQETEAGSGTAALSEQWLLWQLADSAFPTGGFAHSGGLEAACACKEVSSSHDLAKFLEAALLQTARGPAVLVAAAHRVPDQFASLDEHCDAFLTNHVANRASRAQGRALLAVTDRSFSLPGLQQLRATALAVDAPTHLAPAFGAVTRELGLGLTASARLFIFTSLRSWISAAVRLGVIGPMEGQGIQHRLVSDAEAALQIALALDFQEIAQTAPLLDLFQGTQDRLYSRLFQS